MDQLLKVMNFNVSSDGIGAGEHQSLERPFGQDHPERLFAWAGTTASWPMRTDPGGSRGLDDYFTRDFARNIGAEIMGRNKFGPQRGPWPDHEWRGWWGEKPPFCTPVFVMTHHTRPSFTLSDTTFHFVDGDPATVLERAREAAQGKDIRLGGGVTTIRQFLDLDGIRLGQGPRSLRDVYRHGLGQRLGQGRHLVGVPRLVDSRGAGPPQRRARCPRPPPAVPVASEARNCR
ncbi:MULTISPECIES: dihydrofolate reductase family protein [unclassified Streptomyces]|uniref:dihydrofolate reductase family protein n=1 Tax=unclassified Streptomyces TaxID=2593676 RepID=UPI0037F1ED7A